MVEPGDSGGSGPGGEGGGSEPSPFAPRAAAFAEAHAERTESRYAPEGQAVSAASGLGALSFADRVLSHYRAEGKSAPASRSSAWSERAAPPVSWLFPVPWYADALEAFGEPAPWEDFGRAFVPGASPSAVRAAELARRILAPPRRREGRSFAGGLDVVAPGPGDMPRAAEGVGRGEAEIRARGPAPSPSSAPAGGEGPETGEAGGRGELRRRAAALMLSPSAAIAPAAGARASLTPSLAAYGQAARTRGEAKRFEAGARPLPPLRGERARPGAPSARASLAAAAPAGLHHASWADRWLARFSGASPAALASFQPLEPGPGRPHGGAPEVFVAPGEGSPSPAERGAPDRPSSAAGVESESSARGAPVIGDDERVPDEAFAAIAAAAGGARRGTQPPSAEARQALGGARDAGPSRPPSATPPADRLLSRSAGIRGAGFAPELGASPLSPLFEGLVVSRPERIADTRVLAAARRSPGAIAQSAPFWASLAGGPESAGGLGSSAGHELFQGEGLGALAARAPAAIGLDLASGVPALRTPAGGEGEHPRLPAWRAEAPGGAPGRAAGTAASGSGASSPPAAVAAAGRPGAVSAGAAAFARERSLAAADLALDFVAPELVVAAREYGFGPAEALRAARLAAAEPAGLEDLAARVESALEARIEHPPGAGGDGVASPESRWPERAPGSAASPAAKTRGASLWPQGVAEALKIRAEGADREHPHARAALELLAASAVVAAGERQAPDAEVFAASGAAGGGSPGGLASGGFPEQGARGAALRRFAASEWPVFARAARALAQESRSGPGSAPSAQARAAAAWSSLPQVIPGGAGGEAPPGGGAVPESAGEPRQASPRRLPAEIPELVRTGGPGEERSRDEGSQGGGGENSIPSWVEDAARRVLEERSGGDGGVSMAELTLVTAAPTRHVAASPRRPSSGKAASEVSRPDAKPAGGAEPPQGPDVEELARDVYDHIRRMLAVARERSGEPWRR